MKPFALLLAVSPLALVSCAGDAIPTLLQATPPGNGPKVVWDLGRRPLPNIPLPNDVATFADPTSRTGLRVNASLVAPTHMDRIARSGLDMMEGWGTFEPITVAFEKESNADPRGPAVDLADVAARMQKDDLDFSNDAVYLINLTTGVPIPLDVGDGNFPLPVARLGYYFPNDVKETAQASQNLLFEHAEEGAGLTQADYTPQLDQDFDGVLDHPNTFGPPGQVPGVDDLLGWYERETDTLRVRPIIPLDEKTEYAVVLTDRLRGPDGQPVRSPFQAVYHAAQRAGAAKTIAAIDDPRHKAYFGDIAGSGLTHVAFVWTFTTEPVHEDMVILRDGLYGKGPFARFATEFPPQVTLLRGVGVTESDASEAPNWQSQPQCQGLPGGHVKQRYTVYFDQIQPLLNQLYGLNGANPSTAALLTAETGYIDHIVVGTFQSPYLMGDPASTDPDSQFHVNFVTGEGPMQPDAVHFNIVIPKETATAKQPFPVAFFGHGVGGSDLETLQYGPHFAKQGIAVIGIDMPEHGWVLDSMTKTQAVQGCTLLCCTPWVDAMTTGRAHDLNGDGVPDTAGLWWTPHIFHTRDNVRQGILDSMQATRILRSFDGHAHANQDYNGDGDATDDLAGDFDGNGVPDVGGPNVKYYASGESLGGLISEIQGGIDPFVVATAPASGGGGGTDIAARSYGVATPVMLQVLSPLVIGVPNSDRSGQTNCTGTDRSVRFYLNDLTNSVELEIACLSARELGAKMTVVLTNVTTGERRCARTLDNQGRFRVPLPASIGDRVEVRIYPQADVVDDYKDCQVPSGIAAGRRIDTWEQRYVKARPVANPSAGCPASASKGCQRFRETFYPVGSPLVAPQEGLGLSRQTPDLRRIMDLLQAAFDPADPINFAPYYMLRPLSGVDGKPVPPHGLIDVSDIGDGYVNVATAKAFARAAGAIPFMRPTAVTNFPEYADYVMPAGLYQSWGRRTANQVLIDNHEMEGISRFGRTPAGPACTSANYNTQNTAFSCNAPPMDNPMLCTNALFDGDWLGEGQDGYDQQHPATPLRVARDVTVRPTDPASIAAAWAPRIRGAPFSPDTAAWPNPLLGSVSLDTIPDGDHAINAGDPCQAFDAETYIQGTMARFFSSGGTDLDYLSHPATHRCLADRSCPFLQ